MLVAAIPPAGGVSLVDKLTAQQMIKPVAAIAAVPPFMSMPHSAAQITDRISNSPTLLEDSLNEVPKDDNTQVP